MPHGDESTIFRDESHDPSDEISERPMPRGSRPAPGLLHGALAGCYVGPSGLPLRLVPLWSADRLESDGAGTKHANSSAGA